MNYKHFKMKESLFLLLFFTSVSTFDDQMPRFSTFGNDFQPGTNRTCSQQYFNSTHDNGCRLFFIDPNTDKSLVSFTGNSSTKCGVLKVTIEVYPMKLMIKEEQLIRLGVNVSVNLWNDTKGLRFSVDKEERKWFQILDFGNEPNLQGDQIVWNDGFYFDPTDVDSKYLVTVTEMPSGCKRVFQSVVPQLPQRPIQNVSEWTTEIFVETISGIVNLMFQSTPDRFFVDEYTISLKRDGEKSVKGSPKTMKIDSPKEFVFVTFQEVPHGSFVLSVIPNCKECRSSDFKFTILKEITDPEVRAAIAISLLIVVLIVVLIYVYFVIRSSRIKN